MNQWKLKSTLFEHFEPNIILAASVHLVVSSNWYWGCQHCEPLVFNAVRHNVAFSLLKILYNLNAILKDFRVLLLLQNYSNQLLDLYTDANVRTENFILIEFVNETLQRSIAAMFHLSFWRKLRSVT